MGKKNTSIYIDYDFGDKYSYSYEVPFLIVIQGIEYYFSKKYFVEVDGKETDLWNMCVDLDILDDLEYDETFLEYVKPLCEESARLEYEEEKAEEEENK